MSDLLDLTSDREEFLLEKRLAEARRNATLVPGEPGECDLCGEPSPRLVRGACAPCRDKHKLP